jgi:hypothetical protein
MGGHLHHVGAAAVIGCAGIEVDGTELSDAAGVVGGVAERPRDDVGAVHRQIGRVIVQINMDFNGEPTFSYFCTTKMA